MKQLPCLFSFFSKESETVIEIYNDIINVTEKQFLLAQQKASQTLLLFPEGTAKQLIQLQIIPQKKTSQKGTLLEIFWLTVLQTSLKPHYHCSELVIISEGQLQSIGLTTEDSIHFACKEVEKNTQLFFQLRYNYDSLNANSGKEFRFACDLKMNHPQVPIVTA